MRMVDADAESVEAQLRAGQRGLGQPAPSDKRLWAPRVPRRCRAPYDVVERCRRRRHHNDANTAAIVPPAPRPPRTSTTFHCAGLVFTAGDAAAGTAVRGTTATDDDVAAGAGAWAGGIAGTAGPGADRPSDHTLASSTIHAPPSQPPPVNATLVTPAGIGVQKLWYWLRPR